MRRNADALEWHEECFDAVRQDDRARRVGQERSESDQEYETERHFHAVPDTFFADMDEFPGKKLGSRCREYVDGQCEEKDEP